MFSHSSELAVAIRKIEQISATICLANRASGQDGDLKKIPQPRNISELYSGWRILLYMNTAFGCFLLFYQIECNISKNSHIFWSLIFANAIMILVHVHIMNPVRFIFNGPMPSNNIQYPFSVTGQSGNVIAYVLGSLVPEKFVTKLFCYCGIVQYLPSFQHRR